MMSSRHSTDSVAWVESIIRDFLDKSPENTLKDKTNEKAFAEFLVGFSRGADPIFEAYKEHVGPFHWTPQEIFAQSFPGVNVNPHDLTVISWVLLQREDTKRDNRSETAYPSERWARARIFGEEVNKKLRQRIVEALEKDGYKAIAPQLSPHWSVKKSQKFGLASTWSERHAAHASGLGTFGLCDGLITPGGKAMRAGSVIADIQIPPTQRPYRDHHEYCLFLTKGLCGECMSRCPVDAITKAGHDKDKCRTYLKPITEEYVKSHYRFEGYGCGLCQTGVPCESKIPTEQDLA
jgi:epoxyqueuosine reductase QueG